MLEISLAHSQMGQTILFCPARWCPGEMAPAGAEFGVIA